MRKWIILQRQIIKEDNKSSGDTSRGKRGTYTSKNVFVYLKGEIKMHT